MQDRAAPGSNGVNEHHGRAHTDAGNFRFERAFIFAVEMGDVGRCAAHVEADKVVEAGLAAGFRHAHHAASGPRENCVFALEQLGSGQPAGRHHEHQSRGGSLGVEVLIHLRHIAAQDRRQISIHDSRIATADQLDQWRDLVAHRNLRKIHLAYERCDALLVFGKAIGMHEYDRDRFYAVCLGGGQIGTHGCEIRFLLDCAVGAHAFVDFCYALIKRVRLDDVASENFRPGLVTDLECVAETFGDQQERPLAFTFEEGIGSNGCAHFHGTNAARRDRFAAF